MYPNAYPPGDRCLYHLHLGSPNPRKYNKQLNCNDLLVGRGSKPHQTRLQFESHPLRHLPSAMWIKEIPGPRAGAAHFSIAILR
jgi:hypothetical protein